MFRKALLCASVIAFVGLGTAVAQQPPAGIKRTPLQKIEFPEGYTTVTGIAEIGPGGCWATAVPRPATATTDA